MVYYKDNLYGFNCKCPTPAKPIKSNAGIVNNVVTQKQMQSIIIKNSVLGKGGKITFIPTFRNALGGAVGAPYGLRSPPRNSF
jgi:hypothetical protein